MILKYTYMYILFDTDPDLVVTGNNASAHVGDSAVLFCNVTNVPPGTTVTYQWRRADMSPIPVKYLIEQSLYLPYVGVSDAGVYKCDAISDSTNNPYVISQNGSVNLTLIVTSK